LPSDAAGGGTLAVRVTIPPVSIGPRFEDGAPIVVFAPGGFGVGGLAAGAEYTDEGFVVVTFIFPGGTSGGQHSDGIYDYRGQNCIDALRDVLLFAGGRKTDSLGRTITQLLPFPALTEIVGLSGSSNGGTISMAVLGQNGASLPFVATYVGWENPTNGQTVASEAGGKAYDWNQDFDGDGNGIANDDGKNPYVAGYGPESIPLDWSRLAYDSAFMRTYNDPAGLNPPVERAGILLLDGNGNGAVDIVPGSNECTDMNENGRIDAGEDYVLHPLATYETGDFLLHYSLEATIEAEARGLFGSPWPADVADPAEAAAFWSLRDATQFYGSIGGALPSLHAMLVFAASDHVQAADEHLHIQQAYDGLRGEGIWSRLNPDRAYYLEALPNPPGTPSDHDANTPVIFPAMAEYDEPHPLSSTIGAAAGVVEMADRAHADLWIANLEGVIEASAVSEDGSQETGSRCGRATTLLLRVQPNPTTERSTVTVLGEVTGPVALRLFGADGRVCGHASVGTVRSGGAQPAGVTLALRHLLPAGRALLAGSYLIEARDALGKTGRTRVLLR
jgi:hypothetical protein